MTPTDAHLRMLRRLPDAVHEALQAHLPGWVQCLGSDRPDFPGDLPKWRIKDEGDPRDALLDIGMLWLPCNPTAILEVAAEMAGEQHEASLYYTPWRSEEWPYTARAVGGLWPHERQTRDIGRFADAHEAALAVLLDVCGGEE